MKKETIELRLPTKHIATIEKIAKLAGVKTSVAIRVMLASFVVTTEEKVK